MNITEQQIQSFIEGYLTAALWSSTDTMPANEAEDMAEHTVNLDDFEWAEGEAEKLHADCRDFIAANAVDLWAYPDHYTPASGYDVWECMGHDFWLTRNGHGAGFWDRGLGDIGDRLTAASKVYGGVDLYLGDDELVYVG